MREGEFNADFLPTSLIEVAQVIGLRAALTLVDHYGGTRIYVPQDSDSTWEVAMLVGERAAEALVKRYRHESLWIPRCVRAVRAARDAEIRARHAQGERADDLAREYGLTDRAVWYIVARDAAPNDSQITLL